MGWVRVAQVDDCRSRIEASVLCIEQPYETAVYMVCTVCILYYVPDFYPHLIIPAYRLGGPE